MLFKGNSPKLESVIDKIHGSKDVLTHSSASDPASSWPSDTLDEQSLSPGSCATPTSTVDLDAEGSFTVGTTPATPYACQFCDKAFPRLSFLKKHEQSHSDLMPFKCDYCQRLFKHKRSRDRHVKLHTGDKKYRCPHCEAAFSRSDHLKIHLKTHDTQKPFQCTVCNRGYNTAAALTSHMQNHKKESSVSPTNGFRCLDCVAVFKTPEELQKHAVSHKTYHASPLKIPSAEFKARDGTTPVQPRDGSQSYTCSHCSREFSSQDSLQAHVTTFHKGFVNGDLHRLFFPTPRVLSPGGSPQESSRVSFTCEFCTMGFTSVQSLQKHTLTIHSFGDLFGKLKDAIFCPHCSMFLPSVTALSEHMSVMHSQTPVLPIHPSYPDFQLKLKSPVASEGFQTLPTDLRTKQKRSSPSLKDEDGSLRILGVPAGGVSECRNNTFLCNQCNAAFPDFEAFRTHLKTHLDEMMHKFSCPECQVEFPFEEQLEAHVLSHYLATTTEYGCQSCLKLFTKPDELQKHLIDIHAHHLYRCSLCQEVFDSKVAIQVHFAVKHSNECKFFKCIKCDTPFQSELEFKTHMKVAHFRKTQPFRCLFCHKGFAAEIELQYHLTTHQKQFSCSLCSEAFHVEFLLDLHMSTVHGGDADPSLSDNQDRQSEDSVQDKSTESFSKDSKCDICDQECHSESGLMAHRKQAHNIRATASKPFGAVSLFCAYCNESFKSRSDLESHMKSHQVGTGKNKCNICDEMCSSPASLAEHKLTHCKVTSGTLCTVCKVNLSSEEQYYSHTRQHHPQTMPIPCIICRQTLISDLEVQLHCKFHLKNKNILFHCCMCLKPQENHNLIINGLNNGVQTYVCKGCFGWSENRNGLSYPNNLEKSDGPGLELNNPAQYQCIKCQLTFESEKDIQSHVASHMMTEGNSSECKLCHTVFETPLKLQTHLIEHTFEGCNGFTCYMCGTLFTSAVSLQQHMFGHGLHAKPYDCHLCHQKFFFRSELENHLQYHKDAENLMNGEVSCQECAKVFSSYSHLINHMKTHKVSDDLFKCSLCSQVFGSSKDLQSHYFQCHKEGDKDAVKQEFRCSECNKEFPCLSNLQGHMRIHTQGTSYPCPECNKEFALTRNLTIHMRSHSGEKPYECPICSKRFARKENRKAHLKSHTGVKPFMCPHCCKRFTRKCHVKEHIKIHLSSLHLACDLCPEGFSSTSKLQLHMTKVHQKELTSVKCPKCSVTSDSPQDLTEHLKSAHDFVEPPSSPQTDDKDSDFPPAHDSEPQSRKPSPEGDNTEEQTDDEDMIIDPQN